MPKKETKETKQEETKEIELEEPTEAKQDEARKSEGAKEKPAKKGKKHRHKKHLLIAIFQTIFRVAEMVLLVVLVPYFISQEFYAASAGLILTHLGSVATRTLWGYLNYGSIQYVLAEMFGVRVFFDFYEYWKEWNLQYGKSWPDAYFQFHSSHERFLVPFCFLVIQFYVIIADLQQIPIIYPSAIQYFSAVLSAILATSEVFNLMRYVRPRRKVYVSLMLKALFNTMLRTACVAFAFREISWFSILVIIASFVGGLGVYWISFVRSRKYKRDEPIQSNYFHLIWGSQIALSMCFVAFPFAPSHSIEDWWFGYLLAETKINIENLILTAFVTTTVTWSDPVFYASLLLTVLLTVLNFTLLISLHIDMIGFLKARNIYSASPIVNLYSHLGKFTRNRIKQDKELRLKKQEAGADGAEMLPGVHPALVDLQLRQALKNPSGEEVGTAKYMTGHYTHMRTSSLTDITKTRK